MVPIAAVQQDGIALLEKFTRLHRSFPSFLYSHRVRSTQVAAPGQFSLYRVAADPQNGRHALARGHQVWYRSHTGPPGATVSSAFATSGLYCNIPVTVAGRKTARSKYFPSFCGPLAQALLRLRLRACSARRAAQCVGRNARPRYLPHRHGGSVHPRRGQGSRPAAPPAGSFSRCFITSPPRRMPASARAAVSASSQTARGVAAAQQRHGACFQQGHGAVVRFPSGPEIPRCLCCIDRRRFLPAPAAAVHRSFRRTSLLF